MTHTLHRRTEKSEVDLGDMQDLILMVLSAKCNREGSDEKIRKVFKLISATNPDNINSDPGARGMGWTDEEILKNLVDGSPVTAAFSDRSRFKDALKKVKEADVGLSVVLTGNYEVLFDVC